MHACATYQGLIPCCSARGCRAEGNLTWDFGLCQVLWPQPLQEREDAPLPEGVAAIHELIGAPHESTFYLSLQAIQGRLSSTDDYPQPSTDKGAHCSILLLQTCLQEHGLKCHSRSRCLPADKQRPWALQSLRGPISGFPQVSFAKSARR